MRFFVVLLSFSEVEAQKGFVKPTLDFTDVGLQRLPAIQTTETTLYAIQKNPTDAANVVSVVTQPPITGEKLLATSRFQPKFKELGWDFINVKTEECETRQSDMLKMYAAGVLEGFLTYQQTHQFKYNTLEESGMLQNTERSETVLGVFNKMDHYVGTHDCESEEQTEECRYRHQNYLIYLQLHGVVDGHNNRVKKEYPQNVRGDIKANALDLSDSTTPDQLSIGDALRLQLDGAIGDYLRSASRRSMMQTSGLQMGSMLQLSENPSEKYYANGGMVSDHLSNPVDESSLLQVDQTDNKAAHSEDPPGESPDPAAHFDHDVNQLPLRCSAMVKLVKDKETGEPKDLYMGHSTWEDFSESNRMWKVYDLPVCDASSQVISFSSYPGAVSSTDDYMITSGSTKLAITETSLGVSSQPREWGTSKYINKLEHHAPDFIHIMSITRLAKSGQDWMKRFTDPYNRGLTGVYNSQWMLIDYNQFGRLIKDIARDKKGRAEGTVAKKDKVHYSSWKKTMIFMILETAPGRSTWQDRTTNLWETTYWSSFNEPYFKGVMDALQGYRGEPKHTYPNGIPKNAEEINPYYAGEARYKSFAAQQDGVVDITSMMRVMRDASERPEIGVSYGNNICSRPDLAYSGHLVGCSDSKVVSAGMVADMQIYAINGPSTVGNNKPFDFRKFPSSRRLGLPDILDFPYTLVDNSGIKKFDESFVPKDATHIFDQPVVPEGEKTTIKEESAAPSTAKVDAPVTKASEKPITAKATPTISGHSEDVGAAKVIDRRRKTVGVRDKRHSTDSEESESPTQQSEQANEQSERSTANAATAPVTTGGEVPEGISQENLDRIAMKKTQRITHVLSLLAFFVFFVVCGSYLYNKRRIQFMRDSFYTTSAGRVRSAPQNSVEQQAILKKRGDGDRYKNGNGNRYQTYNSNDYIDQGSARDYSGRR